MTEESHARLLAEWLDAPPGTDPPAGLDEDVVMAVVAMRPERAPAPRVTAEDILAGVTAGPFAIVPPTTGQVVGFPSARPAPRKRAWWAMPAVGAAMAAAAAVAITVPLTLRYNESAPATASRDQFHQPPAPPREEGIPEAAQVEQDARLDKNVQPMAPASEAARVTSAEPEGALARAPATRPGGGGVIFDGSETIVAPAATRQMSTGDAAAAGPGAVSTGAAASAPSVPTDVAAKRSDEPKESAEAAKSPAAYEPAPAADDYEEEKGDIVADADEVLGGAGRASEDRRREQKAAEDQGAEESILAETASARTKAEKSSAKSAPAAPAPVTVPSATPSQTTRGGTTSTDALANRAAGTPLDYDAGWYVGLPDVAAVYKAATELEGRKEWAASVALYRPLWKDARPEVAQDAAWRGARALWASGKSGEALAVVDAALTRSSAATAFRVHLLLLRGDLLNAQGRASEAAAAWAEAARTNQRR